MNAMRSISLQMNVNALTLACVWPVPLCLCVTCATLLVCDRCCHAKKCPGDVILAFERLLSDSCYTNASITSPGYFLEVTDLHCIKYLNNAIYPRPSRIILRYLRPAFLYFTCNKPSKTTMCLMFDCVRKVVDSLVCYSVKVSTFQQVSPLASR